LWFSLLLPAERQGRAGAINDLLLANLEMAWTLRVPLLRHIHPSIIIFAYNDIDRQNLVFHNANLF